MPSVVLRSAWPSACERGVVAGDTAKLSGEGVPGQVHVEPVGDAAADESGGPELSVPPAMDGLRARSLLRVGAGRELLLAFRLEVVAEPEGTRGYDDLRYAATREPLGEGLRPSVASPGDLARMLGALGRETDIERLRTLRRVIELVRGLGLEM